MKEESMNIGLIDYDLRNTHSETFTRILRQWGKVKFGYSEVPDGRSWCDQHGMKHLECPEDVVNQCDAILILAPNQPEKHQSLAHHALKSGKPVFVDKILADLSQEAASMLQTAREFGTPVMSASGLRFAVELDSFKHIETSTIQEFYLKGPGKFSCYGIHTLAPLFHFLQPESHWSVQEYGVDNTWMIRLKSGNVHSFIEIRDGENVRDFFPWTIGLHFGNRYDQIIVRDYDGFYERMMKEVFLFFQTGETNISHEEMTVSCQIIEAAILSRKMEEKVEITPL